MMTSILSGWDVMRLLRLGLGIYFGVQAYILMDALSGFLGAFLLLQAITNTGCCAAGQCVPTSKSGVNKAKEEEVQFETIKPK
jgi:hypothetical protein